MSLPELSAVELRRLIGARQVSPVELMDACIARIDTLNPAINAICATDFERARDSAKLAEASVMRGETLGPLHGLPLGVKDLQATKDLLTTYGNIGFRSNVPDQDNSLIARLRSAGAIVTAKTNTPDMGAGANTRNAVWGATGNPFNPSLNAGGSLANLYWLRHWRLVAHPSRVMRGRWHASIAGHDWQQCPCTGVVSDFSGRSDGA
jgi:Asp-tRNA(Asn)/Glu-tRNA(Gln) amidotransferase A subunit family amidase